MKKYQNIIFFSTSLVLLLLFFVVPGAVAHAGVPLGEQLAPTGMTPDSGHSYELIYKSWRMILGMSNILVALILIGLAVINIGHINYDTYQIKKTLPNLIIGVIMANFSFLICRMFISSADILTFTFTHGDQTGLLYAIATNLGLWQIGIGAGVAGIALLFANVMVGIFVLIFALILIFFPFIVLFLIWLILWFRVAALYLLIVIAPAAFVCLGFAPTYQWFKEWWCQFIKYTYMYPAVFFVLWLSYQLTENQQGFSAAMWVLTLVMCYAAVTLPFGFMPCKYANFMGGLGKLMGKGARWLGRQAWNGINTGMERYGGSGGLMNVIRRSRGGQSPFAPGGWSPRAAAANWRRNTSRGTNYSAAVIAGAAPGPNGPGPAGGGGGGAARAGGGGGGFTPAVLAANLSGGPTSTNPSEALTQFDNALSSFAQNEGSREQILSMAQANNVDLNQSDFENLGDNRVRSRVMQAIFGTDDEGLKMVSELQEEAASQGNFTAQDVFPTEDGGYAAYDFNNEQDRAVLNQRWGEMLQQNIQSGQMQASAFSNPAVLQNLVENNILNVDHVNEISRHDEVVRQFTSDANLRVLHDVAQTEGTPAAANARNILTALENGGHIRAGSSAPANIINIDSGDGRGRQPMTIAQAGERLDVTLDPQAKLDLQNQIQQAISGRFDQFSAQILRQVQAEINSSGAYSQSFKDSFATKVEWEGMREEFQRISAQTYQQAQAQAQAQVGALVQKIQTDLGRALESGVDVPEKISTIIRSVPPIKQQGTDTETLRDQVRAQIQTAIKQSAAEVIHAATDGSGQALTAQQIISIFDQLKTTSDPAQAQVNIAGRVSQAAGHNLTPAEMDEVKKLIKAYIG